MFLPASFGTVNRGDAILANGIRRVAAALSHVLLWCCFAIAQQGGAAAAPDAVAPSLERAPPRIEESRPSVYYLPDKQGNLQPVLHFNYQDFVDLYKLKNQLEQRDQPPSYSLQRMTVTGTAEAEHAELTIQFRGAGSRRGLGAGPFAARPGVAARTGRYKGSGEQFLHYEGEGHRLRLLDSRQARLAARDSR